MIGAEDIRWLATAARLGQRGWPHAAPNPSVGAIVLRDGVVLARAHTQAGGRPHAEAMALAACDPSGATLYVSLEPCAHTSPRGPSCADLVAASGLARVVIGAPDPDPRTAGAGIARIRAAGVPVDLHPCPAALASLAGYFTQRRLGRPHITLKLALSLDGCLAMANGESRWITREAARAHTHVLRSQCEAILVGGGTLRADAPALNVRLAGLENQSPRRLALTAGPVPAGWQALATPQAVHDLPDIQHLLIEGGAQTAASFLRADLVDRLVLYRAPILLGAGRAGVADFGLPNLAAAHGRWRLADSRLLGQDRLEIFERSSQDSPSCSPASSPR